MLRQGSVPMTAWSATAANVAGNIYFLKLKIIYEMTKEVLNYGASSNMNSRETPSRVRFPLIGLTPEAHSSSPVHPFQVRRRLVGTYPVRIKPAIVRITDEPDMIIHGGP
jgi:hypothetical protein